MNDDESKPDGGLGATEEPTLTASQEGPYDRPAKVDGEIGAYRILSSLGTGGFAEVFLAEQTHPVHRKVALKIIKPGMESQSVLARFQAERQALALMDHPNVAKVFDAGVTDSGRPFFVMEFVAGVAISIHCDRHHLGVAERLEIYLQACAAVQHAHQKGVIHRDIKPSNVLVSVNEGEARVKVIDFGVAKAIQDHLAGDAPVTQIGQVIGTLEYMSPEQAEMTAQGIDTRTDVYSLGVLLYELLAGTLPFEPRRLRKAAYAEVRRIIRDEEPPRPSTRISDLGEASKLVAERHHTDPRSLIRELRGDLDWITMKAMEKDRTRRYASASELAADIERFRRNEPVLAGPPSAAYRFRKFVRRHRVGVAAAAMIFVVLIAGIVSTSVFAIGQARARARAQAESERARAVIDFLQVMLSSANPSYASRDVLVLDVVDSAALRLERGEPGDPEVEATIRTAIGATYLGLSRLDEAESQLRRALEIQTEIHGDDHASVGETLYYLGWLALVRGELDEAELLSRRALGIMRSKVSLEDRRLADVLQSLAGALQQKGEFEDAEQLLREALEVCRRSPRPIDTEAALVISQLGSVIALRGRWDEAEALQREALEVFRAAGDPLHVRAPEVMCALSWILQQKGELDEAEALSREALEYNRAEHGDDSIQVAKLLLDLGQIERARGNLAEAEALLRPAVEIYRKSFGDDNILTTVAVQHLATVLDDSGFSDEAVELYSRVIETYDSTYGISHWQAANARNRYGLCLMRLGRFEEAERALLEAYEVLAAAGIHDRAQLAAQRLTTLYETTGRDADASRWRSLQETP